MTQPVSGGVPNGSHSCHPPGRFRVATAVPVHAKAPCGLSHTPSSWRNSANAADVTNKDNPITLSNVRVSDVGAQTANVSFGSKIDPAQVDEIKDVCFSIEVQRITDITPIEKAHSSANTIGGTGFPYAARAFPMMS